MGPPATWRCQFGARWCPGGQVTWPAGRGEQLPPTRASPPRVDAWQPSFGMNHLKHWPASQEVGTVGQPLGPLGLRFGPTLFMCQIHPCGDDDFDIWSTSPYHPLKCSNFVPKFLKANKY
jgi:hypothetical protein